MNETEPTQIAGNPDDHLDPITGAPGAHPVGTGVGAASGGAAGAAIRAAVGGPIGAGIGIVAGAVIGGLAGKGAAEVADPTAEDAYWRENYRKSNYVGSDSVYETYQPAYRVGYEGYGRYAGRQFDDVEADLRRDYERITGRIGIPWEKAKPATRDAWDRVEKTATGKAFNPIPTDSGCGCNS